MVPLRFALLAMLLAINHLPNLSGHPWSGCSLVINIAACLGAVLAHLNVDDHLQLCVT